MKRDAVCRETAVWIVAGHAADEAHRAVGEDEIRTADMLAREIIQPAVGVRDGVIEVAMGQHERRRRIGTGRVSGTGVVAAALAGLLFLLYALEMDRLWMFFAGGTFLGLAYLMKQPGIVFAAFGVVYLAEQ